MQYPIIDLIINAYINNGWTGLDISDTITYEPIQLGSGTPSPTNIRPILPATILNIDGNDVPVYGGTLDVTTGVLTVDMTLADLGLIDWTFYNYGYSGGYTTYFTRIIKKPTSDTTIKSVCSALSVLTDNDFNTSNTGNNLAVTIYGLVKVTIPDDNITTSAALKNYLNGIKYCYELETPTTYQLTNEELINTIGIKDDIARRLKLPLPHCFPHPVIDALQRAAAGTQTADDTEILRHYLTPLGIGGI